MSSVWWRFIVKKTGNGWEARHAAENKYKECQSNVEFIFWNPQDNVIKVIEAWQETIEEMAAYCAEGAERFSDIAFYKILPE